MSRFRQQVILQRDDTVRYESGAIAPWSTVTDMATVWANVTEPTSRTQAGNFMEPPGVPSTMTQYVFRIRWRADVADATNPLRIKATFHGMAAPRYFDIVHIPAVARRERHMTLLCTEAV